MSDGSLRWHQWRDHAILDENGQIIEYQSVGKDITEVKELEKQRLAMALERERVQILADFIVAASHDFRTPLSVINTSAYLLNRIVEPASESSGIAISSKFRNRPIISSGWWMAC